MKLNTLFARLVTGFVALLLIYAVVGIAILLLNGNKLIESLSDDYMTNLITYIEEQEKFALQVADPVEIQNLVDSLTQVPWVEAASITLPDFETVAQAGDTEWEPLQSDYSTTAVTKTTQTQRHVSKALFIADDSTREISGYLHIAISDRPLKLLGDSSKLLFIISILGSIPLAVPILLFLSKRLALPVKELGQQLEDVDPEATEFKKINIESGTSEINTVVSKVNKLLEKQRDHVENLEERVQGRTQELDRALDDVRKAESDKSSIMLNFSHDLKTPLTSAKGFLEFGMKELKEEKYEDSMNSLSRAYERVNDLASEIQTLLQFSASTESELRPNPAVFDLEEFMRLRLDESDPEFDKTNNIVEYEHTGKANIITDEYMLQHIVENLISNSNKYCTNGKIAIKTHCAEEFRLSIQDTGIGIPKDDLENIFEKHFQSKQTQRTAQRGVGLGLTLCKQYVDILGGSISVASTEDIGTTFEVRLPQAKLSEPSSLEEEVADVV